MRTWSLIGLRGLVVLPPLLCLLWVLSWASDAPEPWSWRRDAGSGPLAVMPRDAYSFEDAPGLFLFRWARLSALDQSWFQPSHGVFLTFGLAMLTLLGLLRLSARSCAAGAARIWSAVVLSFAVFTPTLGPSWVLGDRWRIFVPVLALTWSLVLLGGEGRSRWRVLASGALCMLSIFVDETGVWCWIAVLPALVNGLKRRGQAVAPTVAAWVFLGNCLTYVSRFESGEGRMFDLLDPASWKLLSYLSVQLPAIGPRFLDKGPGYAGIVLLACLLWGALSLLRQVPARRAPAVGWLAVAIFGGLCGAQAVSRVGRDPEMLGLLRQLHPAVMLFPVAVLFLLSVTIRVPDRVRVAALALTALVVMGSWVPGFNFLKDRTQAISRAQARLVFGSRADLGLIGTGDLKLFATLGDRERMKVKGKAEWNQEPPVFLEEYKPWGAHPGEVRRLHPEEGCLEVSVRSAWGDLGPDAVVFVGDGPPLEPGKFLGMAIWWRTTDEGEAWLWTLPDLPPGASVRAYALELDSRSVTPLDGHLEVAADSSLKVVLP